MSTVKLYQKDVYLKEAELKVLALTMENGRPVVVLEETIFAPDGGGQPCDLGSIGGIRLVDVREDKESGEIKHYLETSAELSRVRAAANAAEPSERRLFCELDWQRRFDHMQMHCAEHILSGAFHRMFKVENRGFHMGADYFTIDMFVPEGVDAQAAAAKAELESNRVIWANVPVTTTFFSDPEEAARRPVRKPIKADEDVSVVSIGEGEALADCCACCGTHPARTGEAGCVKIVKAENYKGLVRYTVKAGRFAYEDYKRKDELAGFFGRALNTDLGRIEEKYKTQEAKNGTVRKELYDLKKALLAEELEKILELLDTPCEASIRVLRYDKYSMDDLQSLAKDLEGKLKKLLVLVSEREISALLLSDGKPDAGKLVKENAAIYKGKGGGNPKLARAIFDDPENLELYLDLIEKHLR